MKKQTYIFIYKDLRIHRERFFLNNLFSFLYVLYDENIYKREQEIF
uniref:RH22377p n=1 Tax=Drosophila melanogaster TaxID=7227 RepID=Q8SY91_DROME|nr:RH22377p [Drosophila melanogaster]